MVVMPRVDADTIQGQHMKMAIEIESTNETPAE